MHRPFFFIIFLPLLATGCHLFRNKIDVAIESAVEYLRKKENGILPMVIPTLDYLIKDYKLAMNIETQKKMLLNSARHDRRPFLRALDPSLVATPAEIARMNPIDRITGAAFYCDIYPLPANFFRSIRQLAVSGGYDLTHASLALIMAKSRGCKITQEEFDRELNFHKTRLLRLLARENPASDLGIEAIVMLYLAGNAGPNNAATDLVKPQWIVRILDAQDANGSWYDNDHTTVLAIWALLESKRHNTVH